VDDLTSAHIDSNVSAVSSAIVITYDISRLDIITADFLANADN
jgi:hypothetical protein